MLHTQINVVVNNVPYVYFLGSPSIVKTYQCSNCVPLKPGFCYVELPNLVLPMEIKSSSHPLFSALHIKPQKRSWKSLLFWRPDLLKILWGILWGCYVLETGILQTVTSSLGERQWSRMSSPGRVVPHCYCSRCRPYSGLWKDSAGNGLHVETTQQTDAPPKEPIPPFCQNLCILLQSLPSASFEHDFLALVTARSHHHHPHLIH